MRFAARGGLSMHSGSESLPDTPIPFVFLEHAFGMKLQPDDKAMARVVEGFD